MAYHFMFASEMPRDPYPELLALHRIAFGQYEGVLPFDETILRWYIRRPGLGLEHTLVILYEETIVSSLFLTVTSFVFEGNCIPVGIIDTVMTHPDHRGKGLATRLMKEAEALMRGQGCFFGYLYTIPETKQFGLYRHLGYRDFQRVFHLQGKGYAQREETAPAPHEEVRQFLNQTLAGYNGFIPFDEPLWSWRKTERPEKIPARILASRDSRGKIQGAITASWGEITTLTGTEKVVFLSDWAGATKVGKEEVLRLVLSSVGETKIDLLCPVVNREEWTILEENGFRPTLAESAMLLPLRKEAEVLLEEGASRAWYPLIESVVGV